jgi:hypothetical protein
MKLNRREFLQKSVKTATGIAAARYAGLPALSSQAVSGTESPEAVLDERGYLREILYTRKEVDDWFAGKAFPFSRYHSAFGWLLPDARFKDGVDDSVSVYTYAGADGERIMGNYGDQPCRINTYGDSFTQCHQVSDHETWQEVLAAHLQEPVRNFGIGGWSVYQAYLRMLTEEQRKPAKYIILNIYEDDHKRNLDAWRNIRVRKHPQHIEATLPFMKVNLRAGTTTECKNPCPTHDSVYDLCDLDKTYQMFKDDFVLKIMLAHRNAKMKNPAQSYANLMALSKTHGITTNIDNSDTLAQEAETLHQKAAFLATKDIVDKTETYARVSGKKVLYVLSYSGRNVARYVEDGTRFDQAFVDFMQERNLPCVDLLAEHARDFAQHRLNIEDYVKKYFIGHYNPRGNFFCALALKDKLVETLHPKPLSYQ